MPYRKQKRLTITDSQVEFVKSNVGVLRKNKMAQRLGITYNKLNHNYSVLGLPKLRIVKAKVVNMGTNFNDNEFFNHYKY